MYLVLKAKFTDNERGLPDEWPVKANPCKTEDQPPFGWIKLSKNDLEALKRKHQNEYNRWEASKKAEQAEREKEEKMSEEAPCKSAEKKLEILGFTKKEIRKILGGNYIES